MKLTAGVIRQLSTVKSELSGVDNELFKLVFEDDELFS